MNRDEQLRRLKSESFDVLVIGGGATGLGCALDAAARGYRTALIEAEDFAKGTSSRSTKLIHGGVRYLQQGNISLVREALHERAILRANAPELVRPLAFLVPTRHWWETVYYGAGLRIYDALAGLSEFPRSRRTARGVLYWDAQFDDARLAIALARTAVDRGAAVANYVRAESFERKSGALSGVNALDSETQERFGIEARVVVNAGGIFADTIRHLDDPAATPLLKFSRGSHIVVAGGVMQDRDTALLVPHTRDGRVVFAIPWHEHTLIGTTDIPIPQPEIEPHPAPEEIDYILATANPYLSRTLTRDDVRTAFAGIRPLVSRRAATTARLSREHLVDVSPSGLVTITGGKWTTYRKMAEDTVDAAERQAGIAHVPCPTANLRLHDETATIASLNDSDRTRYAAEREMARTVEDVLARRTRTLFIDADRALAMAPACAQLLAQALNRDDAWKAEQLRKFGALTAHYTVGNRHAEAKSP
jgi:glycerol-3-phosphate dehydrogenase